MKTAMILSVSIVLLAFAGLNNTMGQWNASGNNIYNTNTGNVGIGNNSPSTLLYVGKNMTEPTITVRNLGGFGGATYAMVDDASGANWKFKATTSGGFKIRDNANSLDVFIIESNSAANALYINAAGSVGIGNANPSASAALEINSNNKGFLPPRMTTSEISMITNPFNGLTASNTTDDHLYSYTSTDVAWKRVAYEAVTISPFVCGNSFQDSRDGNTYQTVQVGSQCWMKENLNYATDNSWCYNNDPANCATYGRLYNWTTIMSGASSSNSIPSGVQGICPTGWHVPSDAEWDISVNHLGGSGIAGGKMKEAGFAHWNSPNTGATNVSGFTALPGGYRDYNEIYGHLGIFGYFWSSTEYSWLSAWLCYLYYDGGYIGQYYVPKGGSWFSLRCLRD